MPGPALHVLSSLIHSQSLRQITSNSKMRKVSKKLGDLPKHNVTQLVSGRAIFQTQTLADSKAQLLPINCTTWPQGYEG